MTDVPRVVSWHNQASPYVVRRLNELHTRGNVAIEAWFSELRTAERSWTVDPERWRFPARLLPPGARRAYAAVRLLRREPPDVLVTLYGDISFSAAALAAKASRIPVVVKAMKTNPAWRRRSLPKEAAKHAVFRLVDGVHACGPDSRAYAESYGAAAHRIFPIREEIDLAFWTRAAEERAAAAEPRTAHGLNGCVVLCVGRLWRGKGLDALLDANGKLRADGVDCSLVLVGDGPDEERLRARASEVGGVVFAGFAEGEALRRWYAAADVFAFPTLGDPYGHVVQEAMAAQLPVVATTAAGDIRDRVLEGKTGFLVPPDDPDALADRLRLLARDPALRRQLGAAGYERIQGWSTELWATRFEDMVFTLLRRDPAGRTELRAA